MTKRVSLSKSAQLFDAKYVTGKAPLEAVSNPAPARVKKVKAKVEVAPVVKANVDANVKLVRIVLPSDTKVSQLYFITPVMGNRPRWFEKKRLTYFGKLEDGSWEIELPEVEVKGRKLIDIIKAA